MKIDPADILGKLSAAQRQRLVDIARAQKALPWKRGDDRLKALKLIGKMTGPLDEPLAEISHDGWTVLNWMGRKK